MFTKFILTINVSCETNIQKIWLYIICVSRETFLCEICVTILISFFMNAYNILIFVINICLIIVFLLNENKIMIILLFHVKH